MMLRFLLASSLLFGIAAWEPALAKAADTPVVVRDAYLDLRTGPGRGFPAAYSVERGATVVLLRQRTDWIKVRTDRDQEGWVNRAQLERTLTPGGEAVRVAGPTPESKVEHRWETALATGDFGGANTVSVQGSYALASTLFVRADATHLLGNFSNGWLGTAGIAHVFAPQWRVSPFLGLGGGVLTVAPKATLVQAADRTDSTAYVGLGARGYLTNRFLLQAEYRSYVVFTSRDDNEEIDAWSVAFTYFF